MKISHEEFIYSLLQQNKRISNKELSLLCNISIPTVRKIGNTLIQKNKARSIYGGLHIIEENIITSNILDQYNAIAEEAIELIKDGDSIFLGPGKTVATLCNHIKHFQNLTVFTNSFYVIENLTDTPHITVVVIGGLFQRENKCFSLIDQLPNVNISKIFISGTGINPKHGVYHSNPSNRHTEEIFAKQAQQVIILVDKSKFGLYKPFVLMPINIVDCVITTDDIDEKYITDLKNQNIEVRLSSIN